jgi:hypothetical protein
MAKISINENAMWVIFTLLLVVGGIFGDFFDSKKEEVIIEKEKAVIIEVTETKSAYTDEMKVKFFDGVVKVEDLDEGYALGMY